METRITRREVIRGLGGVLGATVLAACEPIAVGTEEQMSDGQRKTSSRMPAVFLPHGGGPWPFIDVSTFGPAGMWDRMSAYMHGLSMLAPDKPRAVLVVSAHWEEAVPTVMTATNPSMLYDYYGFPAEAYEVQWPAPGAPDVAADVLERLREAGFASGADAERGFDHGAFVPLKLAYPQAEVPTFQLSLKRGLDAREHLAIGRLLEPLRNDGVFIVGSGMSYHNLPGLMKAMRGGPSVLDDSRGFDDWLAEAMGSGADRRETLLTEWESAPRARAAHPREEHLLPLMVVAGAAGDDAGSLPYRDVVMGAAVSAVHFG